MKITEVIYFGYELDMLECHIATHRPCVDRIVIAESPITVSGLPKPMFFQENKERFRKYDVEHEIIPAELFPRASDFRGFRIQDHVKNDYMHPRVQKGTDWIMHTDTDEILNPVHFPEVKETLRNNDWHYAQHSLAQYCTYMNMRMGGVDVYRWVRSDVPYKAYVKNTPRGKVGTGKIGWHFHNVFSSPAELYWKAKNREWWVPSLTMQQAELVMGKLGSIHTLTDKDVPYMDKIQGFFLHDNVAPEDVVPLTELPQFMQDNQHLFPVYNLKS